MQSLAATTSPTPARWLSATELDMPVLDWHKRLVCSKCGGREIDFVLTGARRGGG